VRKAHINTIKQLLLREKLHKGIVITDHLYRHITDISDDLYVIDKGETYLTKSGEDLVKYNYINSI